MNDLLVLLEELDKRGEYGGPGPHGATTGYTDRLSKDAAEAIRQLIALVFEEMSKHE